MYDKLKKFIRRLHLDPENQYMTITINVATGKVLLKVGFYGAILNEWDFEEFIKELNNV